MSREEGRFASEWVRRREERRRRLQALAAEARADLAAIIEVLTRQYGVRRVILFGSLRKGRFVEESDIDLAVEGLRRADFYEALGAVNRLSRWWVDLKPLEDLEPFFRERVLREGEQLFPRGEDTDAVDGNR
ncbi:MAG: nucleotidyltransferase domain-containing protein [Chloroflexi bacterium]|nr:MAG: nucleotidyltransferase domain-containing protein [Chloroflexota bacterium]